MHRIVGRCDGGEIRDGGRLIAGIGVCSVSPSRRKSRMRKISESIEWMAVLGRWWAWPCLQPFMSTRILWCNWWCLFYSFGGCEKLVRPCRINKWHVERFCLLDMVVVVRFCVIAIVRDIIGFGLHFLNLSWSDSITKSRYLDGDGVRSWIRVV